MSFVLCIGSAHFVHQLLFFYIGKKVDVRNKHISMIQTAVNDPSYMQYYVRGLF